jgi:glycosyltransferase involved in cell wall biosynthesis
MIYSNTLSEASVSVCIPTFNGATYIGVQLESILVSPLVTEIIVSDDGSTDNTVEIIRSFNDKRIILIEGPCSGLVNNYELLLSVASGEYIFLADQDDVWLPNKVEVMLSHLHEVDMVVCDCIVVDGQLNMLYPSFFALINSKSGVVRNLLSNCYLGCCIALRRRVLKHALPFPAHLPVHDWWLGLVADIFGGVTFINQPLMMYRRHGANASPASERSSVAWTKRIYWRVNLLISLIGRKYKFFNE